MNSENQSASLARWDARLPATISLRTTRETTKKMSPRAINVTGSEGKTSIICMALCREHAVYQTQRGGNKQKQSHLVLEQPPNQAGPVKDYSGKFRSFSQTTRPRDVTALGVGLSSESFLRAATRLQVAARSAFQVAGRTTCVCLEAG